MALLYQNILSYKNTKVNNTANTSVTYRISAEDTSGNRKETSDYAYRVKAAPPAVRDVAVTRVTPSPAEVSVGENVTITVIVKNNSSVAETFNVTTYCDTARIDTQTITDLAAGANKTLTFAWDTTGVDAGGYTIRAAATLSGDTNTANNALNANETVTVKGVSPPTMPWMWLGIGVAMAVVAVVIIITIIVAAYMLTRKKP